MPEKYSVVSALKHFRIAQLVYAPMLILPPEEYKHLAMPAPRFCNTELVLIADNQMPAHGAVPAPLDPVSVCHLTILIAFIPRFPSCKQTDQFSCMGIIYTSDYLAKRIIKIFF
jgi:hypothetical protein